MSNPKETIKDIEQFYETVIEKTNIHSPNIMPFDKELGKKIKLIGDTSKDILEHIKKRKEK